MLFSRARFSTGTARSLAVLILILILVTPALASSFAPTVSTVVDEFDTQIMILTAQKDQPPATSSLPNGGGDASILGGQRDVMATVVESSFPSFYKMNVAVVGGQLSVRQDTSVKGTVLVTWDGPDNDASAVNPLGLSHRDLKANSQVQFGVQIASDDRPASDVTVSWVKTSDANPLAAALGDFQVVPQAQEMMVNWETVSEIGVAGFNVWRGTAPGNPDDQLNATLIPAQAPGSSQGFAYTWPDGQNLVAGSWLRRRRSV